MNKIILNIFNIVGNEYCVEADDGEIVYKQVYKILSENNMVELSFLNVEKLTTAFLNTAVGQMYRDFSEEQIKESLSVSSMQPTHKMFLKKVTDTAKLYYRNPERMQESINKILGE